MLARSSPTADECKH